jgi:hypothetical protein
MQHEHLCAIDSVASGHHCCELLLLLLLPTLAHASTESAAAAGTAAGGLLAACEGGHGGPAVGHGVSKLAAVELAWHLMYQDFLSVAHVYDANSAEAWMWLVASCGCPSACSVL